MADFEDDICFNRGRWKHVIESQYRLFDIQALIEISDRLREEFHQGHAPGRKMPMIAPEHWASTARAALAPHAGGPFGYDLPCLISADRETQGRIMLCAQDPHRSDPSPAPTVGTFFGIDDDHLRYNRNHHGALWRLIRSCAFAGYEVLVTDALKIFVGKNEIWQHSDLVDLCYDTLVDEIAAFQPDKILTIGGTARDAIDRIDIDTEVIHAWHPNRRGAGWYLAEGDDRATSKLHGVERYYCRKLFGADTPPA